jgi:predicted lipoprotein
MCYSEEAKMNAATSPADAASAGLPIGSVFVKGAELWMGTHRELISGIETIVTGWMDRQRHALEASSRSMRKVCDARNIFDLVQAQQEWVSDCFSWTASEIRAVGNDAATISRKAVERLAEPPKQPQTNPPPEVVHDVSLQRAAAE